MPPQEALEEKTEEATPRRRRQARERGYVARSQEVNTALLLLVSILALRALGRWIGDGLIETVHHFLAGAPNFTGTQEGFMEILVASAISYGKIIAPLVGVIALAGILANAVQVGFVVSGEALTPRIERLDPVQGFRRIFSQRGLVKLAVALLKFGVIGVVAYLTLRDALPKIIGLAELPLGTALTLVGEVMFNLGLRVALLLLLTAVIDYGYERWEYEQNLRMTREELREELRQMEGDPYVKARIRRIQRQLAMQRMMEEVPKADVIITNPVELAVALKYDARTMSAPKVVAKGARLMAERIKKIAREHGVPIVENKPLARALYKSCQVGQEIPVKLYRAVAEVLAYVWRVRGKRFGLDA